MRVLEALNHIVLIFAMRVSEALSRTFLKHSNILATSESESQATKTRELLAFRTIITMLSFINSLNSGLPTESFGLPSESMAPIGLNEDRKELRVLDALSAVLIRQHERTAVVAQPYDGYNLQVFASVVFQSNTDLLLHPHAEPEAANVQGIWSRLRNFTLSMIMRDPQSKINSHTDSLINSTPIIGNHKVPDDLVTAAKDNVPLLDIFLKNHW